MILGGVGAGSDPSEACSPVPPCNESNFLLSRTWRFLQVCVEAGMLALRRDGTEVCHEDFNEAITEVQAKKKANLNYYA